MRIGIVGNCQSNVTARWLERMLPDHDIVHHSIARPEETFVPASQELAGCDIIISQWIGPGHGPLETAVLSKSHPMFIQVPNLIFTGFQPDMTYLPSRAGGPLPSPLGVYHSRIIVACFHVGLGPIRTKSLFNSYIYDLLGYFDEFAKARLNLEEAMKMCDLPISTADLMAHGKFMHTINHANVFANRILAAASAQKAGLNPVTDVEDIADELSEDTIWPIYPAIARRVGIQGGDMTYQRALHIGAADASRELSLGDMIEKSFAIYDREKDVIDFTEIQKDADLIKTALRRNYA